MLRVLLSYLEVAIFQPELRKLSSRATLVLKSCEFPARLRVQLSYLKVAIFQELRKYLLCVLLSYLKCTSRSKVVPELRKFTSRRTTFVLKSYDFPAGAALLSYLKVARSCRGPGGNRTRDRGIAKAGAQTTRQLQKAISQVIKSQRHDLRREFAATKTNSRGAAARARRHARSPQRAAKTK